MTMVRRSGPRPSLSIWWAGLKNELSGTPEVEGGKWSELEVYYTIGGATLLIVILAVLFA